ncbi:hypothetical protein GGS23DRAFT_136983 [Durotheca rogersii]|uniref:uncharacterized protein n=1 Tax=Durotheca rogersii TaxID=419775 RepID=UPI00221E9E33|nr:uncharacterized protein GGS23DRAFT_136983 [Durotheca rogersii]KAI5861510.1 hypothetical protein GGS23DRAFT_136983 [Durotheca rogersii]
MLVTKVVAAVAALLPTAAHAEGPLSSCPNVPPIRYPFNLAPGWSATKVLGKLTSPRSLVVDSAGRLLIVEQGVGVSQHLVDPDGCVAGSRNLISLPALSHAIYLATDQKVLYASSPTTVFAWTYDPTSGDVGGSPQVVVRSMSKDGHQSRSLIIPPDHPEILVVSHGSDNNIDPTTSNPLTGRAIVKAFNITTSPSTGYNFVYDGWWVGYGLRNSLGLALDRNNMLWAVENSARHLTREVQGNVSDINQGNPAEEINFLGDVSVLQYTWFGFPVCYTVWTPSKAIMRNETTEYEVGDQFVLAPNPSFQDDTCIQMSTPPKLGLPAHSEPYDAKFDAPKYDNLFVTLHGSWDVFPSVGYKLVAVPFGSGAGGFSPVAQVTNTSGYVDILYPYNEGNCSSGNCTRPTSIVFDAAGRLYLTSDTSGEVFVLKGPE